MRPIPDTSVLLPCYNAGKTLEETLDSIHSQTYTGYELICVDDGSTDNTLNILQERARHDSRLEVIPEEHGGVIKAANRGLEACRGEFIIRMDADDRCHPERFELQRQFLLDNPETTVVSSLVAGFPADEIQEGFQLYYDWLNSLKTHQDITREIFVESPIANPSAAFRHSWIRDLGGYQDHGWPEDYDLWLRFYLAGARFAKIDQVLLEWREHPQRLTHQDSRYSLENFLRTKAHYLTKGPARERDAVIVWGAGMTGRRLSKHLIREGLPVVAFVDVDQKKIGRTKRGRPIISSEELLSWWCKFQNPILVTAVRARKAAPLIQGTLKDLELVEGRDWWRAA
jgi:glycosyltransferase involved in cell wall biosynthesis